MNDILHDIPGIACYMDDCIIFGRTLQEYNEALENILTRFREVGVCLNVSKCKFAQEKVEFIGHVWSGDGVSPNPEKIKALSEMQLYLQLNQDYVPFLGLLPISGFASFWSF